MSNDANDVFRISGILALIAGAAWLLSRRFYFVFAILLAAAIVASLGYVYISKPVVLSIAAGPENGKDAELMRAFETVLEGHKAAVRLRTVTTAGLEENRALLEKGSADLAIIRADQGFPGDSSIVVILRTNVLVVVAPARLELETLSQLKGKRLGLIARSPLDEAGATRLLRFYGMQNSDVNLAVVKADEVAALTDGGRLDAVAIFGPIVDPEVAAVVDAVDGKKKDGKKKKGPSILAIDLSGLAEKNTQAASEVTIPKNAFPRRRVPDDDVDSIGVPTVLVANNPAGPLRAKIRAQAVMEITRNLIERRSELSQKVGYPVTIEKPDNEKGVRLPVHPGASAYLDDTDISWYTLFSDQIWTVWLLGGTAASVSVALLGFLRKPEVDPMQARLDRLASIVKRARAKPDELDALTDELADLGVELATLAYARKGGEAGLAPVQLAYESARFALQAARERQAARSG